MRRLLPLLLSLLLLAAACESGQADDPEDASVDTEESPTEEQGTEDTENGDAETDADPDAVADQPDDAQATFVSPADGDVLPGAVPVQMEATGVEIVPADAPAPGEAHFHIVVDAGCVAEGAIVPGPGDEAQADGYYHFGDGASEGVLDLEPGSYELCVQLADGEHRAFGGTDVITVTVVAGRG